MASESGHKRIVFHRSDGGESLMLSGAGHVDERGENKETGLQFWTRSWYVEFVPGEC
jgi:hypothetical protein